MQVRDEEVVDAAVVALFDVVAEAGTVTVATTVVLMISVSIKVVTPSLCVASRLFGMPQGTLGVVEGATI